MRATIKRVSNAGVVGKDGLMSSIQRGLCVEVGFHQDDTMEDIEYIVAKVLNIRFFATDVRNYKKTVVEKNLEVLCVYQPSFFGVMRGNKMTFPNAMADGIAQRFYEKLLGALRDNYNNERVKDGGLGHEVVACLETDGCATATLDSRA